jgi:hypothetical protein
MDMGLVWSDMLIFSFAGWRLSGSRWLAAVSVRLGLSLQVNRGGLAFIQPGA